MFVRALGREVLVIVTILEAQVLRRMVYLTTTATAGVIVVEMTIRNLLF